MREARYWSRPGNPVEGMEGGAGCWARADKPRIRPTATCLTIAKLFLIRAPKNVIAQAKSSGEEVRGTVLLDLQQRRVLAGRGTFADHTRARKAPLTPKTFRSQARDWSSGR